MPKPKDTKDLTGLRGFFDGMQAQFASAATVYDGPLKAMFDEVSTKLKSVLDGLPTVPSNEWCLTDKLDWLFDSLTGASSLLSAVTLELQKAKQDLAVAATRASAADTLTSALAAGTHLTKETHEAAVTAAVEAAIAKRTGADGDLMPRTQANSLCSAAKDLGITEGREALTKELAAAAQAEKLVTDRKAALTTAGIALPGTGAEPMVEAEVNRILRASEEDFTAARTQVTTRLTGFTEAGITLPADLAANVWLPEREFGVFQKTVAGITALKRTGGRPGSPFAGNPEPEPAKGGKRMVG